MLLHNSHRTKSDRCSFSCYLFGLFIQSLKHFNPRNFSQSFNTKTCMANEISWVEIPFWLKKSLSTMVLSARDHGPICIVKYILIFTRDVAESVGFFFTCIQAY
uniref:Uncharacterized protein n=1 Tax=Oryza brachyantha TaxID=4533 RepID=J3MW63_ORYBR